MPPWGSRPCWGQTFLSPSRFAEAAAVTVPDRGSWGCHRTQGQRTAAPGFAALRRARGSAAASPAPGARGERPQRQQLYVGIAQRKFLPSLETLARREMFSTLRGGNSLWGSGRRRSPDAPRKSRCGFAPIAPHPLAKLPPFPRVSSASQRGRKSHLMQTKVV